MKNTTQLGHAAHPRATIQLLAFDAPHSACAHRLHLVSQVSDHDFPQHFLYFMPEPQRHGSFGFCFRSGTWGRSGGGSSSGSSITATALWASPPSA
eukprot:scaffold261544_cov28-Tisochrysis_lutea.AAC.2